MPTISGNDLVMVIQAVDHMMAELEKELKEVSPEDDYYADVQEQHFCYEKTSWNLREAYEEALKLQSNLPPYEKLVRKRD